MFSLGATLYRMLTGQDAFDGRNDAEAFRNTLNGRYRRASSLSHQVPTLMDRLIRRSLSERRATGKDDTPAERFLDLLRLGWLGRPMRYATAAELADALEAIDDADRSVELAWMVNTWCPPDEPVPPPTH